MSWTLEGEYLENCSCDVLCPCITSSLQGPADTERCILPLAMRIGHGSSGDVTLDGLCAILVCDTPQVMGEGNWRVAVYIDERADEAQRAAVPGIMELSIDGLTAPNSSEVIEITNVFHPMGSSLPVAVSRRGVFDHAGSGIAAFDHTGKNGHYRDFSWAA